MGIIEKLIPDSIDGKVVVVFATFGAIILMTLIIMMGSYYIVELVYECDHECCQEQEPETENQNGQD